MAGDGVRVAGVVFGDTKDGGQFNLLNPEAATPAAFGEDPRYGDVAGNERAAGNYAFFREYGRAALGDLGPGWNTFDLLADDAGGLRPWNFHATGLEQISAAAAALALDVADAIALTAGAETAASLVVYSAGGGANVAAEAVGYLLGQGYAMADLVKHFAVVQHGNNWVTNYEDEARELTRELTIAISNQNYDTYADGSSGPDLKHAIPPDSLPDGSGFGAAFAAALAVATGGTAFAALPEGTRFRSTLDASDAGSHAFATDRDWLLAAWGDRVGAGELHTGLDWAHLIDDGPLGLRDRVLYDGFDAAAIAALLAAGPPADPAPVTVSAAIAASGDDHELIGGGLSVDLDLGGNGSAAGWVSNPAGLRFTGLALDPGAAIVEAYFLFQAKTASTDVGGLVIELEASRAVAGFAADPDPFAARSYLAETVAWDAPGAWAAGQFYRTPDLSGLLATLLADDGLGAEEALGFRVSGTGARSAYSFDSPGAAPRLVITTVAEPDPALPDPDLALPLPDDLV